MRTKVEKNYQSLGFASNLAAQLAKTKPGITEMRAAKKFVRKANAWLVWVERPAEKRASKSLSNTEYFWFSTEEEAEQKLQSIHRER